jgi:hypothetical protein
MTTVSHPAFELNRPFVGFSHRLSRWLDSRSDLTRQPAASSVSLATREIHAVTRFRPAKDERTPEGRPAACSTVAANR